MQHHTKCDTKKSLEIPQPQGLFPSSFPISISLHPFLYLFSTHSSTSKGTSSFGSEMGFPMGYSELPKLFLQLLFLRGHLRRFISWAFNSLGLGGVDSDAQWPETTHHHQLESNSVTAELIQKILPVLRFEDLLLNQGGGRRPPESCTVCLCEFEGDAEVRRLSNCLHVFHRCCLDRWVEHDQCTCPLCRIPLVPVEFLDEFGNRVDGFSTEYSSSSPSASSS